jgi:hypothetical protein
LTTGEHFTDQDLADLTDGRFQMGAPLPEDPYQALLGKTRWDELPPPTRIGDLTRRNQSITFDYSTATETGIA